MQVHQSKTLENQYLNDTFLHIFIDPVLLSFGKTHILEFKVRKQSLKNEKTTFSFCSSLSQTESKVESLIFVYLHFDVILSSVFLKVMILGYVSANCIILTNSFNTMKKSYISVKI